MIYKECTVCKESKPFEDFYKQKARKDGLMSFCKLCDHARKTNYLRKKNPPTRQLTLVARELNKQGKKFCPRCKEVKNHESFYTTGQSNDGFASYCIVCYKSIDKKHFERKYYKRDKEKIRGRNLQKKFGLTLEQYNQMAKAQDFKCAVCKQPETSKSLAVDHDHKTGQIRGLLCGRCNPGLGFLKDDPERIRNLVKYLEQALELCKDK